MQVYFIIQDDDVGIFYRFRVQLANAATHGLELSTFLFTYTK